MKEVNVSKNYTVELTEEELKYIRSALVNIRMSIADDAPVDHNGNFDDVVYETLEPYSKLLMDLDKVLGYPFNPNIMRPHVEMRNPYAEDEEWQGEHIIRAYPVGNPYAKPEPEGSWTCPNCGTLNPGGQLFCSGCGSHKMFDPAR